MRSKWSNRLCTSRISRWANWSIILCFFLMLTGCSDATDSHFADPVATKFRTARQPFSLSPDQVGRLRSLVVMPTDRNARVSEVIHVLRLHGPDVQYRGRPLLDALLDNEFGTEVFGKSPMVATKDGLSYTFTLTEDTTSEYHQDQVLATFAQLGLPVDTKIRNGDDRPWCVMDVVTECLARFHLKQRELEWSTMGLAAYAAGSKRFENQLGETWTFDQLVDELLERNLETSSCGGTHRLEAMACIYAADLRKNLLKADARRRLESFLVENLSAMLDAQQPEGSWAVQWWAAPQNQPPTLEQSLLATGHICEFLQSVPLELFRGKEVEAPVMRAVDWLLPKLILMQREEAMGSVCPVTHAAHAVIAASAIEESS